MNPSDYTDCDIDKMQQIDNENYQNRYHDKSVKDYSSDVGKGPKNIPGITGSAIMSIANAAQELQEAAGAPGGIAAGLLGQFDFLNPNVSTAGFSSILGECYTGPPLN